MNNFNDRIFVCIYCGDIIGSLTEKQIERFGKPECCEFDMLPVDRDKIHTIVRAMDNLKSNLEEELLEGIL